MKYINTPSSVSLASSEASDTDEGSITVLTDR